MLTLVRKIFMSAHSEHAVEKIRRDHDYLLTQIQRIKGLCSEHGQRRNCRGCLPSRHNVCQESVEQVILNFVEVTLRHNLVEAVYMEHGVPKAHRHAHLQAHIEIAEQLKAIRIVFAGDGNCVLAIEGVDRALTTLTAHFEEFDRPLEQYLLAA